MLMACPRPYAVASSRPGEEVSLWQFEDVQHPPSCSAGAWLAGQRHDAKVSSGEAVALLTAHPARVADLLQVIEHPVETAPVPYSGRRKDLGHAAILMGERFGSRKTAGRCGWPDRYV